MPIKLSFPEGRKTDPAFVAFAEKMLTDAGVSQQQADHIAGAWQTHVDGWLQTDASKTETTRQEEVSALRKHWGDRYDNHIAAGRKAASALGLDAKALDALDRTLGVGATMDLLARVGARVSTDTNTGESKITITDPVAARAEIARLSGDRAFQDTLRDTKNPTARADALAKWDSLHAAGFPAAGAAPAEPASPEPAQSTPAAPANGSPAWAKGELARLTQDSNFQQGMRSGPNRTANVETWRQLHELAGAQEGASQ